jgi:hypothetical protein
MSSINLLVSLLAFTSSVSACAYGTSIHPRAEGAVEISKFGYTGLLGPLNWAALDITANALCSTGTTQSPIDITTETFTKEAGSGFVLKIADQPAGAEFENLGTNVEVVVNGTLENAGKTFSMKQFHFHTPSEHRLNGEYFAMETHFVFESEGMLQSHDASARPNTNIIKPRRLLLCHSLSTSAPATPSLLKSCPRSARSPHQEPSPLPHLSHSLASLPTSLPTMFSGMTTSSNTYMLYAY